MNDFTALLREARLFAELGENELAQVVARATTRRFQKGDTLWKLGEQSDHFLLVAEGELAVLGHDDEIVARLSRGESVGEIGLLLGEPRSATVVATCPTLVLVLDRSEFESIVRDDPRVIAAISAVLADRLRATTRHTSARTRLVCAIVGRTPHAGTSTVACFVAARLSEGVDGDALRISVGSSGPPVETIATHERWSSLVAAGELAVRASSSASETNASLATLIEHAARIHRIVVVDLGAACGLDTTSAAGYADVVIEVGRDVAAPIALPHTRVLRVCNENDQRAARQSASGPALFVVPYDPDLERRDAHSAAEVLLTTPRRPAARTLHRLVRAIERRVVGIAFGAGAALGLAHIGVLRVLEARDIPIDVVAGSSMGAVIGLGHATGATAAALEATAKDRSSFRRLLGTVDVATTGDGLIAGRQLLAYLRPFLQGAVTFDDLVLPARVVATDLAAGQRVVIEHGLLEHAVRASIAMPPFITPLLDDNRILVDGGLIDPIPVDVVRELGADIVIGVNAVSNLDGDAATVLTRVSRGLNLINPFAYLSGRRHSLNLLDVVMRSFQVIEHQLGAGLSHSADIVVQPDLGHHTWIEFYHAEDIIERGATAAEHVASEIESIVTRNSALHESAG